MKARTRIGAACALLWLAGLGVARAADAPVPVNCGDPQAYPSTAVLVMRGGTPVVRVDFQKQKPPYKKLAAVLKECLEEGSKAYSGPKDIESAVQLKGVDDHESAESVRIYYSQQQKAVKLASVPVLQ
ncbi:MAG: hypothetical protein QG612_2904 [Pseudomonadota bacterium]|jgi:hypothetical protein|nr:hypothetical protein [Pseudomonadota bacterium]